MGESGGPGKGGVETLMEVYANNASTTVGGSGYTAGSLVLNVSSTALPFPQITTGQQFHVTVLNGNSVVVILKVTAINSTTQWVVAAEGTDANASSGDTVLLTLTAGAFNQIRQDQQGYGTYANLPAAGAQIGDSYHCSDVPFDFHWNGSSWVPQERCSLFSDAAKNYGAVNLVRGAYVVLAGGATTTIINLSGVASGFISRIHLMNGSTYYGSYGASVINVYRDGSSTADITAIWELFGCMKYSDVTSGPAPSVTSEFFSHLGNSTGGFCFEFKIPIPYNTGIEITVTNGDSTEAMTLWWEVEYHSGIPNLWNNTRRLLLSSTSTDGLAQNAIVTMLNITGLAGRLFGLFVGFDGYPGSADPVYAIMEGQFKYTIDGTLALWSSGYEDHFGFNGYGGGYTIPSICRDHGMTARSSDGNWVRFYRWHVYDPIIFTNSLLVTVSIGDSTRGPTAVGVPLAPPYPATGTWRHWYSLFYYINS